MRYLILSDLHLGDPRSDEGCGLIGLLSSAIFDELILAGDILDTWLQPDAKKVLDENLTLIMLIRRISETHPVTWLVGNHEMLGGYPMLGQMSTLIPNVRIADQKVITMGVRQALVIHGYQIENKMMWLGKFLLNLNISLWNLTGWDMQRWFRGRLAYRERYRYLQDEYAAKNCIGRFTHLILGHTHIPDQYSAPCQVKVFNCGDWLWHNSYVTIVDNEVTLHGV